MGGARGLRIPTKPTTHSDGSRPPPSSLHRHWREGRKAALGAGVPLSPRGRRGLLQGGRQRRNSGRLASEIAGGSDMEFLFGCPGDSKPGGLASPACDRVERASPWRGAVGRPAVGSPPPSIAWSALWSGRVPSRRPTRNRRASSGPELSGVSGPYPTSHTRLRPGAFFSPGSRCRGCLLEPRARIDHLAKRLAQLAADIRDELAEASALRTVGVLSYLEEVARPGDQGLAGCCGGP